MRHTKDPTSDAAKEWLTQYEPWLDGEKRLLEQGRWGVRIRDPVLWAPCPVADAGTEDDAADRARGGRLARAWRVCVGDCAHADTASDDGAEAETPTAPPCRDSDMAYVVFGASPSQGTIPERRLFVATAAPGR